MDEYQIITLASAIAAVLYFIEYYLLSKKGSPDKTSYLVFGVFYTAIAYLIHQHSEQAVPGTALISALGIITALLSHDDLYVSKPLRIMLMLINIAVLALSLYHWWQNA